MPGDVTEGPCTSLMARQSSRNAVGVDGTEVDADFEYHNEDNFELINGELLDQNISEVKLD